MNYHIVSTSNAGHGAIFTNQSHAKAYQADHPGSVYRMEDSLPDRIPPKSSIKASDKDQVKSAVKPSGQALDATTIPDIADLRGPLTIHTDGSCVGNPGPGGYGVMIVDAVGGTHELAQGYEFTTNSRMEIMGVIATLGVLEKDMSATLFCDNKYVIDSINLGWARGWKAKGWKKGDGKLAKNHDLWGRLLDLLDGFDDITFKWVKGHDGDPLNEKADRLANGAARGKNLIPDDGYKAPGYRGADW